MPAITKTIFRYCLLLSALFVHGSLCAQDINELKKEIAAVPSVKKKVVLAFMADDYYFKTGNVDSDLFYINMALRIARSIGDDSLIMEAENRLGIAKENQGKYAEEKKYIDSAILFARKTNNSFRLLHFLITDCIVSNYTNGPVLDQCNDALSLAIALKDKKDEAKIYGVMAGYYAGPESAKYDLAFDYYSRSMQINDSLRNYFDVAVTYKNMMSLFGVQKKYVEALKYGLLADSFYTALKAIDERNYSRINLAIIYKHLGQYDAAMDIYKPLLTYFKVDSFYIMKILSNMGSTEVAKKDYKDALIYLEQSQQLNNLKYHEGLGEFSNYKDIANVFFQSGQLDSALYYGKLAEVAGLKMHHDEFNDCILLT